MAIIYEPKGRAREYAALACNIYNGCDHKCRYCYAKRLGSHQETRRRKGLLDKMKAGVDAGAVKGKTVHLCFTCDAYQSFDTNVGDTRRVIELIHSGGGGVAVLTKGGQRALRDIDLMQPGRDVHAATLTCITDGASLEWEYGAASPADRIYTLQQFHARGITTWVSLEPVIYPADSIELIKMTHGFVDIYKVGKMNYHETTKNINWRDFAKRVMICLDAHGYTRSFNPDALNNGEYYIKQDLAKYL